MSIFNFLVSKTIMHVPGPIVGYFARSYIAGDALADAVRVSRELNSQGMLVTLDVLGEFITSKEQALSYRGQAIQMLQAIDEEGIDGNVSIKPTQMGLELDKDFCFGVIRDIVEEAVKRKNFVRIDMEDVSTTDDTLDMFRRLRQEFPGHVGTVLQSYLRRTPQDVVNLGDGYQNYRLCKGIYIEERKHAWKDPQVINGNFVYALEKMFKQGAYVGIATHDTRLVFEALRLIEEYGLKKDQYEFQMLLGVDEELRRIIVDAGHRLRVYVPFGRDWLPYSKRRLKENPNIARHALIRLLHLK